MAVRLGKGIRPALSLFGVTCFICLLWAGYLNGQQLPFYVISVIAPFILCLWHIWSFDDNDPQDSLRTFMVRLTGIITSADLLTCTTGESLRRDDGLHWIGRGPLL